MLSTARLAWLGRASNVAALQSRRARPAPLPARSKLPFHLARERQQPQLMSLVDPRIPVDVALDAAR